MKKVSLILLLVIVLSTVLMAAVPTRMLRLTVINKSGYDVFIKLTGSAVTESFYYLTIPSGDQDLATVKVFTVMSDVYARETWQCNGFRTAGTLIMDGNVRLTFTPCGQRRTLATQYFFPTASGYVVNRTGVAPAGWTGFGVATFGKRFAGEPRMEKIVAFQYLQYGDPNWAAANLYTGYWVTGCATFFYRIRTWRTPVGCAWRYQY